MDKDVNDNSEKGSHKKRQQASHYRDREYLFVSEVYKVLEASKKERSGKTWYCLFLLIFKHALRVNEALNLKWSDINWQSGHIKINRLKDSVSGTHPLSKEEIRSLKSLLSKQKSSYIFISSHGKPLSDVAVRKCMLRIGQKLNLPFSIHPHMLRHSAAIAYLEKTKDLYMTKEFLGHREIDNTLIYLQMTPGRLETSNDWFR